MFVLLVNFLIALFGGTPSGETDRGGHPVFVLMHLWCLELGAVYAGSSVRP